jgi:hypothetical protein
MPHRVASPATADAPASWPPLARPVAAPGATRAPLSLAAALRAPDPLQRLCTELVQSAGHDIAAARLHQELEHSFPETPVLRLIPAPLAPRSAFPEAGRRLGAWLGGRGSLPPMRVLGPRTAPPRAVPLEHARDPASIGHWLGTQLHEGASIDLQLPSMAATARAGALLRESPHLAAAAIARPGTTRVVLPLAVQDDGAEAVAALAGVQQQRWNAVAGGRWTAPIASQLASNAALGRWLRYGQALSRDAQEQGALTTSTRQLLALSAGATSPERIGPWAALLPLAVAPSRVAASERAWLGAEDGAAGASSAAVRRPQPVGTLIGSLVSGLQAQRTADAADPTPLIAIVPVDDAVRAAGRRALAEARR